MSSKSISPATRKIVVNAAVRELIAELAQLFEQSLGDLERLKNEPDWEKQTELSLNRRTLEAQIKGCSWRLVCAATGRRNRS